jgi:DNA-binding response OmpR family regulator
MKRILLIDDEEGLRHVLRICLERLGYEVIEARDGADAIGHFMKMPFDLVLTDLVMPGKEGLETIRELRLRDPELKIIAMSGGERSDSSDNLKMALLFGATSVFSKPFSLDELARGVAEVLAGPKPDFSDPVFLAE